MSRCEKSGHFGTLIATMMAAIAALVSFGPSAQAATCPSPVISGDGYVTVTPTGGSASCVDYGSTPPNINGNSSDPIVLLGYKYITGLNGTGTFGQVTFSQTSDGIGTFTVNSAPDAGYTQFVLAIKDGDLSGLSWGAFLLSADVTGGSWSLYSAVNDTYHALSGWGLYECSSTKCPANAPPPSGTPIPGAMWLFGTVLAGGAGFGRWRNKRKAVVLAV